MSLPEQSSGSSRCENCLWLSAEGIDGIPLGANNEVSASGVLPDKVYIGDKPTLVDPKKGNFCVNGTLNEISDRLASTLVPTIVDQQPRAVGGPEFFHIGPIEVSNPRSDGKPVGGCIVRNLFGPRPQQ